MKAVSTLVYSHNRKDLLALLVLLVGMFHSSLADDVVELWKIAPGDRTYMTTGNLERGVGIDPVTGSVLLLSRAGAPTVYVLDGATGDDGSAQLGAPRSLLTTDSEGGSPISGGTIPLNLVGVAEDGAVFAANLTASGAGYRIYRWAKGTLDSPVEVAYEGDPFADVPNPGTGNDIRLGDTFAVRGSGSATQIAATTRSGRYLLVFATQDGRTFTPQILTTDAVGKIGLGLAFGDGSTLWAKLNGQPLLQLGFDLASKNAVTIRTIPTTLIAANVTGIGYDRQAQRLAAVNYTAHVLTVFDLSDPANPISIGAPLAFATANSNGNGTGAAAIAGERLVGLDTNNGLLAARVEKSVVAEVPSIVTQPANTTVYATGNHTFAVVVQGTPPFSYQWLFEDQLVPGPGSSQLTLTGISTNEAGKYSVVITNVAGSITSQTATLTVKVPVTSARLSPLWALPPASRPYLAEDNTQRGLAVNPVSGHVLLVSRTGSNQVVVLDGRTGAEKHTLRMTLGDDTPIGGGTFAVNQIGVAEDGAVFVGNLTLDGSTTVFRLYRWASDGPEEVPVLLPEIPELAIAERWGDALAVRGSGDTTEIALTSRNGLVFAVMKVADAGATVTARVFSPSDVVAGDWGLGLAFGQGSTLWATATGKPLLRIGYDFASGSATILQSFPGSDITSSVGPLGVSPDGYHLGGLAFENPDNFQLFDVRMPDAISLVDQELLILDRPNLNGTGAISFGRDVAYVLDTNNGIQAYRFSNLPPVGPATLSIRDTGASGVALGIRGTAGASYRILKSPFLAGPYSMATMVTLDASGGAEAVLLIGTAEEFYTVEPVQ